eukprot:1331880-Amphidinium_carterae.1
MAPMPPFNGGQKGFAGGKGGVIGMPPGKMKAVLLREMRIQDNEYFFLALRGEHRRCRAIRHVCDHRTSQAAYDPFM